MQLDPQLYEEIARRDPEGETDAIIHLVHGAPAPDEVRLVSRFGDIATCRLARSDILTVRRNPSVRSLKASRRLNLSDDIAPPPIRTRMARDALSDRRRPAVPETGAGVIVGIVDYGCDFAHHAFREADGSTRLLALWDQRRDPGGTRAPEPFGRGRLFERADIDAALSQDDPYDALEYHPAPSRNAAGGAHGCHVMDIAAGNGRGAGPAGIAPQAGLVFVHVASGDTGGLNNFGDSVGVLEAVDFIARVAGDTPCVINLSMGRCGGPHDGSTLIEQALDRLLAGRHGLSIVQSAGNYREDRIHCAGRLRAGGRAAMTMAVPRRNAREREIEIWYPGADRIGVTIEGPGGSLRVQVPPGRQRRLRLDGAVIGRAYNRLADPGNGDNHIDVFLYDAAPSGRWRFTLLGTRITDGNWNAWIERDGPHRSRFVRGPVSTAMTCGTIAHGRGAIQVAALDRRGAPAWFSSAGPSRDGRAVPVVSAPGALIRAARSAVPDEVATHRETVRKSGTSMASPHVTGLVALMLDAAPSLTQRQIRAVLRQTSLPLPASAATTGLRARWGAVEMAGAVGAARRLARRGPDPLHRVAAPPIPAALQGTAGDDIEQAEQVFPPVTPAEWAIVSNWVGRGQVPTDGAGALPLQSLPNVADLPFVPADAARSVAQALLNHRGGTGTPLPNRSYLVHPVLDPLARILLPAMAPSTDEWNVLGAFMEAQTTANRSVPPPARILFGSDERANRRVLAQHLACLRLQTFPGGVQSSPLCLYPATPPIDPAIQILAQMLTRAGPLVDWSAVSSAERRVHVMHRLITGHGYSRAAAAGIVGNLQSESGVLPERVEGSAQATPRRSRGMIGRRRNADGTFRGGPVRRHSAADIMARSTRPLRGPFKPGIGLAQWTTAGRRRAFYAHRYAGVRPGPYMIFHMDAQIDRLVEELRVTYRALDRILRNPRTTRHAAADEFVYDFERPGSILIRVGGHLQRRPRADPAVQRVFRARRRNADTAEADYARAHDPAPAEEYDTEGLTGSAPGRPGTSRPCCIFHGRFTVVPFRTNIIEAGDLTNHLYDGGHAYVLGNERSGIIYTCRGGFVDFGHAREWADWTRYIAYQARTRLKTGGVVDLGSDGGKRKLTLRRQGSTPGDALCILLGQRIAYEMAIWHEIVTWTGQRASSFSPEDNYSNLIGTYMAADALRSAKGYETAMVDAMAAWLTKLGPMSRANTQQAFTDVEQTGSRSGWWQDVRPTRDDLILRRHFDALGVVRPWLVGPPPSGFAPCMGSGSLDLDVPSKAADGSALKSYYELSIDGAGALPSAARKVTAGRGRTPITPKDYPALIAHTRAEAKKVFGADADKPY